MLEAVVTKKIANTANTLLLEARCNSGDSSSEIVTSQKSATRSERIPTVIAIAAIRAFRAFILVCVASDVATSFKGFWKATSTNFHSISVNSAELWDDALLNAVSTSILEKIDSIVRSTATLAATARKRIDGIFNLVLRCLIDYGANVNVEKYAYRCSTSRRNSCSCHRWK